MKIIKLWEITIAKKGKKPASFVDTPKEWYSPYILIEQMEWHPIRRYTNDNCPVATKDDILIVRDGSIGKTATNIEWIIWSTIVAITPLKINKDYLHYFIKYSKPTILANPKWSGLAHINPDVFWNLQIPLYSIPQQQSIVNEIEKQFSRLDNGLQSLEDIKTNLNIYKSSVLKSAIEGKLWSPLMKDTQVSNNKPTPNFSEQVKNILPEIPAHRCWTTAILWCETVVDCHNKTAPYEKDWIILIRTTNVRNGNIILDGCKYVSEKTYLFRSKRYFPKPWDIIFTREAPMWEVWIIPDNTKLCMWQRMMALSTDNKNIINKFLLFVLLSPFMKDYIRVSALWTGVKHLRVKDVENIPIPLPPITEQRAIVQEVEEKLSVTDNILATVEANIKRAQQLKQSILHQAFIGKLVSMKDDDTWVAELLAEIERTKALLVWQKKTKKAKQK